MSNNGESDNVDNKEGGGGGGGSVASFVTDMQSTTLWRASLLANVLCDAGTTEAAELAFRVAIVGLERSRATPAISKPLEVRLMHHEQELANFLKRHALMRHQAHANPHQLHFLRLRAVKLCRQWSDNNNNTEVS